MVWLLLQHTIVTALLMGVVALICRLAHPRPAIQHGLWAVVLVKFMIPPVVIWPWSVEDVATSFGVPVAAVSVDLESARPESGEVALAGPILGESGTALADGLQYFDDVPRYVESDAQRVPGDSGQSRLKVAEAPEKNPAATQETAVSWSAAMWPVSFWPMVIGVWLIGIAVYGAWNAWKILRLQLLVLRGTNGPQWLRDAVAQTSLKMGVQAPVVVVSSRMQSPFIWCLPGMKLVWPLALTAREASVDVECLLVHELAHVRRRDHWVAWLDLAVKVTWWWNPFAWYARRRLKDAAELACDNWVIRTLPDQRRVYADALVTVCQNASDRSMPVPAMGARTGTRRAFERRLVMIMSEQVSPRHGKSGWIFVGLLLLATLPGIAWATLDRSSDEAAQGPQAADLPATDLAATDSAASGPTVNAADVVESFVGPAAAPVAAPLVVADPLDESEPPSETDLKVLAEIIEKLSRGQAEGVDKQKLIEAAIEGMLQKVDENAAYLSRDDMELFHRSMDGTVGVGVVLKTIDDQLVVLQALPSSPARKAGVQSGDVIEQIDGKLVATLQDGQDPLVSAVKLIRGKPGKSVTLGVRHEGSDEVQQIRIVRAAIKVSTVHGYARNDEGDWKFELGDDAGIGYVRVTSFNNTTAQDVEAVVRHLESAGTGALVLDLRDCPGGLLKGAVQTANLFVDKGLLVRLESETDSSENQAFRAKKKGTHKKMLLAVLINQHTASAAEILAACLKDRHRAVLIGQRTYGRGVVQRIVPLKSGRGALRLTSAKIVRSNGKYVHRLADADESGEWGVQPTDGLELRISDEQLQQLHKDRQQREYPSTGPGAGNFQDVQLKKAVQQLRAKLAS